MLHMIWSEGILGPLRYTRVPAHDAMSAKNWLKPITIDVTSFFGSLVVDSKGILHVIYSDYYGEVPGLYYIRSEDEGETWSTPTWLDPDIPEGQGSLNVHLGIDENDGLHALWHYIDNATGNGTWIRYANSIDGGNSWKVPITIDQADESSDELRMPYPEFLVDGKQVHIIWAGNNRTNREHRYSTDAGQTLSPANRILGDLVGQALGGGLDVDSLDRLHYVTQVRAPLGIYHSIWENGNWSIPSLAYYIGKEEVDPNKIHAHNVRLAIRAGNQLVVAFTTSPLDPQMSLYVINGTLNDAPEIPAIPTPTAAPTSMPISTPVNNAAVSTTTPLSPEIAAPPTEIGQPSQGLIWGIVPAFIILSGMIIYWALRKR